MAISKRGDLDPANRQAQYHNDRQINQANSIEGSELYQQAYQIFSADKQYGEPYLNRLMMIPESFQYSQLGFLDNIGLSVKGENQQIAQYNAAMAQIQNLVNEYYDFINTLPASQRQQMADAGVNVAISGQGLSASSMQSSPLSTDLQSYESADAVDAVSMISSVASSLTSVANAFTSVYSAISSARLARKNFKLTERVSLFNMDNTRFNSLIGAVNLADSLTEAGFDITGADLSSSAGLMSFLNGLPTDIETMSRLSDALPAQINSIIAAAPHRYFKQNLDDKTVAFWQQHHAKYGQDDEGNDIPFDRFLDLVVTYKNDEKLLGSYYNGLITRAQFESVDDVSEYNNLVESINAKIASDRSSKEYDAAMYSLKLKFLDDAAKEYKRSKSPEARAYIMAVIEDLGLSELIDLDLIRVFGSPAAVGIVKEGAQIAGDVLDNIVKGLFKGKNKTPSR